MSILVQDPVNTVVGEMSAKHFHTLFNEWKCKHPKFREIATRMQSFSVGPGFDPDAVAWVKSYSAFHEIQVAIQAEYDKIMVEIEAEFSTILVEDT
jgi:hypothetical protein